MQATYVIAGSIKRNGKMVRGVAAVDVEAATEFDCELKALQMLPPEAQWQRGHHAAEVWPIDSERGLRLAYAADIIKADAAISDGLV